MKIFIIGPGGVGKSTCGPILASMLDCKFIDLDEEFCQRIVNIGCNADLSWMDAGSTPPASTI